jgi:translocation and assembly module TamB
MNKLISLLKKTLKIISWIVIGFVILFFFIAVIIQLPFIQTKIVRYATTFVSDKTHTKVEIKNIHISFPKSVNIQGLYLEDINKDTLLFAGKLQVNISFKDLFNNKITLNSVALEEVIINLKRIKNDSLFNYNFLITAFSDTTNNKNLETNKKSNWIFSINNVSLKKIRINYDDKYGGTKADINLNKLKLKMQDLDLVKSVYHIDNLLIEGLTAKVILKESEIT